MKPLQLVPELQAAGQAIGRLAADERTFAAAVEAVDANDCEELGATLVEARPAFAMRPPIWTFPRCRDFTASRPRYKPAHPEAAPRSRQFGGSRSKRFRPASLRKIAQAG